ncbi:MAG: DUF362 domain-containing protein [Lachnospiraceae bacterium]|nr:DUF362 domain-containing protein [Lachnospiraceae bacterium]
MDISDKNTIYKAYGTDYRQMTKRLLGRAGFIEDVTSKMKKLGRTPDALKIAIKPNLLDCTPADYGATTHLEIVEGIIEVLKENNFGSVTIMEGSWVGGNTQKAFEYCGYNALAAKWNVGIIDGQKEKSYRADCQGLELNICRCYQDVDYLINVPVLKGHCQTKITCALKNMKGLIPNSEKRRFHTMGLHKPIAHLNTHIHQDFIVVDHICGDPDFEEGGNPLVRNCIMAAKDPVLVDAYTADILGYRPYDVEYIRLAEKLGVGSADLSRLRIVTVEGDNNEDLPDTHKILTVSYAVEDVDSCSACYSMLIGALNRLKEEDLLDRFDGKISIGQGYRGKTGICGVGNCTAGFKFNIPGCPPDEEMIYRALKEKILRKTED